jgi:hypothetical protein
LDKFKARSRTTISLSHLHCLIWRNLVGSKPEEAKARDKDIPIRSLSSSFQSHVIVVDGGGGVVLVVEMGGLDSLQYFWKPL